MVFKELRIVFRRWLKAVFTSCLKSWKSQSKFAVLFLVKRITADLTLGGGVNTCASTEKRYSIS